MKNWLSIKVSAILFIMISFVCTFGLPVMAQEQPDLSKELIVYKGAKLAGVTGTPSGLWHKTDMDGKTDVWYYGQDSSMTYDTGSITTGDLEMNFSLLDSNGDPLLDPSLEFDTKYETEGGTYYDKCQVTVGSDIIWGRNDAKSKDPQGDFGWESISKSLSSYVGDDDITLTFHFDSKDSIANDYFGWAVHNVSIASASSGGSTGSSGTSTGGLAVKQFDFGNFPDVEVYVEVKDSNGDFVSGLDESNFVVKESGSLIDPLTVTQIQSGTNATNMGLVIDQSGSMSSVMSTAKQAVKDFIDLSTGTQDQIGLVSIGSYASSANNQVEVLEQFTTDNYVLKNAVDPLSANGMTPFYDGVAKAIELAAQQSGMKYVIAFTDGNDTYSKQYTVDTLIDYSKSKGVPVYTIAIGNADKTELQKIAAQTGGEYTEATSAQDLLDMYNTLKGKIQQQYKLSFSSMQDIGDNACYDISVTLPSGDSYNANQCEDIPGPPSISLTADTKDMLTAGGAPSFGNSVKIEALVTDPDGDDIEDVSLFYRAQQGTSNSFSKLTMDNLDPSDPDYDPALFTAEIPAADYVDPGVEFYITASDGTATRKNPSKDYYKLPGSSSGPVTEQIFQIAPKNNDTLSFGISSGQLDFTFTKIAGATKYKLYIQLSDLLNNYSIPIEVELVPPGLGSTNDPWGSSGSTSSATPGFTESLLGMTFSTNLDTVTWDSFAQYDITWGVEALDDSGNVIGSTFKNQQPAQYANKLKLVSSQSINLKAPANGSVLDQSDSAPTFKWVKYPGVSTYNFYLAHQGALGFDKMITETGQTLNLFPMDSNAWQTMDTGQWYWTVMGYDSMQNQTPSDFTIFDFEVK